MYRFLSVRVCAIFAVFSLAIGCDSESGGGGMGMSTDATNINGDAGPQGDGGLTGDAALIDAGRIITPCVTDDMCPEDQYCRVADDEASMVCAYGCREGGCMEGRRCDLERRNCVRDLRCSGDEDCFGGEYCNEGECADGCRVGNEDDCPRDDDGMPRTCDPETHTCAVQVVCCGANNACTLELPDACDTPLEGERGCFNPNPCRLLCEADADCEAGLYCGEDGRCVEGCRLMGASGCRDDRICDASTRECVRPPCQADGDCPNSMYCDGTSCIPGCRTEPDNCRSGEYCDAERRRCLDDDVPQDCRDDAQCVEANGAGWFCDGRDCQPPCQNHAECPAGEACGPDGRCFEGCRDDGLEENDERGAASALVFDGNSYDSGEQQLYACARDSDWYTFDAPAAGMTIDATAAFTHEAGNLDMRLYGPDGEVLATASSRDDNENIRIASEADDPSPQGQYWVEVYGRGFDENSYRLSVTLARGLGPDDSEPDNSAETATVISLPNLVQSEEINDRTIHPDDEDWFAIDMGERDGLSIRLDMLGNDSGRDDEFTFELYSPGYQPGDQPLQGIPSGAGEGANGVRYVDFNARRFNALIGDGRYYLRVKGLNGRQVGRYRLVVSVDRWNILCVADEAEPNNASETAHDLMARDEFTRNGFDGVRELRPAQDLTLGGLTLCNDEDWYQVALRQDDSLEVRLERQEMNVRGDTQIEIYDSQGNVVADGINGNAVNIARIEGANDGIYRVRLQSRGMTRTAYNLVVFRTAGALPCPADRYDAVQPNGDRASASAVNAANHADLLLCGADGDEDWYSFNVDSASTVTVALRFSHQQGNLDLDLFYGDQQESLNGAIRAGHSDDDDEVVVLQNRAPGNYQVRVRSIGRSNVRYSMEITVDERVWVCQDDSYEPNSSFAEAVSESFGQGVVDTDQPGTDSPWACVRQPIDHDTYHFIVPAGISRTIATSFLYGDDGDLFMQLFDADEMSVLSTGDIQRGNSKQCMIIPAGNVARGFYLRVAPLSINQIQQDDERLDYRLVIQPGEDCGAIPPEAAGVDWPRLGE